MATLIHSGIIVNEGKIFKGYIVFSEGIITHIGEMPVPESVLRNVSEKIDAEGCYVLPGVIDTHVHFRDGGEMLSPKGNMESESLAALKGGVTSFFDMPNTAPLTVTAEAMAKKIRRAAEKSAVNYAFFIGATNSNLDVLLSADYQHIPGIKLFMGASTGNMLVDSDNMLEKLFACCSGRLIAVHAEEQGIINACKAALISEYGTEDLPVTMHSRLRSREACIACTEKAINLALRHDARLHILHISTAEELAMIAEAKAKSRKITAETCPHYLYFSENDYARLGARIKCNPAIKAESDRLALLDALADGTIDTIATDHAPHLLADKEGNLFKAASGMPGVQFSLPLMLNLALELKDLTLTRIVQLMSHNPARLYGISRRGFLRVGYKADITLVREVEPYIVSDEDAVSLCGWTPYAGITLRHKVVKTILNGCQKPELLEFD